MKKRVIICSILLPLLILGGYTIVLFLSDSVYCYKHSYKYYVLIRSIFIKDFPVIDPVSNVVYYYRMGEGNGPINGLTYVTKIPESQIKGIAINYLSQRGYHLSKSGYPDYTDGQRWVRLEINEITSGTEIIVDAPTK